jgi:hypothetical protein
MSETDESGSGSGSEAEPEMPVRSIWQSTGQAREVGW